MNIIRLTPGNTSECAKKAVKVLRAGGVVLYPTDTLYGLGADALSDEAVGKIYAIKGREEGKPMHCIVADLTMTEQYAELNWNARLLAKHLLPGPLTLILKKRPEITTGIARGMQTIGIRIPKSDLCITMSRAFDGPITTTSANKSGKASERTVEKILEQFDGAARLIDLVIDAGDPPAGGAEPKPSTIVDISEKEPVIVREGAIDSADMWEIFRAERH